ncbi:hypothetical protein ACFE04_000282 [Oxalis oulophora]
MESDPKTPLLPLNDHHHHHHQSIQRPTSHHITLNSLLTPNNLYILLGPLLCTIVCLCVKLETLDGQAADQSRNMLAVLVWIFAWWLTEAVPMPITSMSPLFLFPLFGITSADSVAKSYMDDVIALVLGSFILALAVEHYNIHKRLALNITILFCGDPLNPPLLLLGICATTAFVSMWMHNVAAAVMMMPVATGILQRLPQVGPSQSSGIVANFCKAVVLGVIYSAAIGGMSTLTGTGVNLILVGMWKSYFPLANPIRSGQVLSTYLDKAHLKSELETLGPMAFAEKMVLSVFGMLIVLWMTRNITDDIPGWGSLFHGRAGDGTASVSIQTIPTCINGNIFMYDDLLIDNVRVMDTGSVTLAVKTVMMATLLFIIPNKKQKGEKLMDWNKCKKLPWNIILLLGAGFAIADGVRSTGLADVLTKALDFLQETPYLAIAPLVCLISSAITEFTSNNATTTLLVPLLIQIAETMHVHPMLLMVPGAIGAQFAFLLPTGTPSNIVGFTTGHIQIKDMIKTGLPLKIAGIAALSVLMPTLGAYVFGTDEKIPIAANIR